MGIEESLEAIHNGRTDLISTMLATYAGLLALFAGLLVLLVPLLTPELARQRDSFWGAVVLLLGLTLVTCSDRLVGAPMVAVLCATLLIGRLSLEVSQGRWRQLSPEEKQALTSIERWQAALQQLAAATARLLAVAAEWRAQVIQSFRNRSSGAKGSGKRWVRPEATAEASADGGAIDHLVVHSLREIDSLIAASGAGGSQVASSEAG